MRRHLLAALCGLALLAGPAAAQQEVRPAIVFDMGGRFDRSFNEAVHRGGQEFQRATGIQVAEFEVTAEPQREQALRNFARRGQDPIVAVGFAQRAAVETVAREFPNTRFVVLDSFVDLPNVRSVLFREEQGSYLAGMMAAMASRSGRIGFVGGMDIPLIRKFACGYVQGARAVNPQIQVFQNMTGSTPAAWRDPVRGSELARSQIERGADVIFHAAGGTGRGVLQAAADAGRLGIGVDSNQNHLHPGHVLTSMLKRVDVAARLAFEEARAGRFTGGRQVLGLAEDGVGVAFDEHNDRLVTAEMRQRVDRARAEIVAGRVSVHDFMTDNNCPVN
ncbi:BMP family lipoprotein [Falsiroseomonas oryziterrae]|uniref:BMP family lipoprotein n=1 Tax=Falsiroseomonas oryziterrae TaxID=2911368 RepID=UPI001F1D9C73|nr:BMP family ABC transporter substrate-binding protein [Roseomonas sp. NPKOSM-4]